MASFEPCSVSSGSLGGYTRFYHFFNLIEASEDVFAPDKLWALPFMWGGSVVNNVSAALHMQDNLLGEEVATLDLVGDAGRRALIVRSMLEGRVWVHVVGQVGGGGHARTHDLHVRLV